MSIVGEVESLWRYPVKSMRGEELAEAFVGFSGVYGDRLFAFRSSARPEGFPYLTGREQEEMLLYRPRFRHPDKAAGPPNLAAAEAMGVNPLSAAPGDLAVESRRRRARCWTRRTPPCSPCSPSGCGTGMR